VINFEKISFLYKNYVVHNLISHPLSEIVYWLVLLVTQDVKKADDISGVIHDSSLPPERDSDRS
jgi:hypothetical protein